MEIKDLVEPERCKEATMAYIFDVSRKEALTVVEEANQKFGTHFAITGGLAERGYTYNDVDLFGEDRWVLGKEIAAAIYISRKLKIHMDVIPFKLGEIWHVNGHTRRICRHEFDFPEEPKSYWCSLFHVSVSLLRCDACPRGDGPCPFWTERVLSDVSSSRLLFQSKKVKVRD